MLCLYQVCSLLETLVSNLLRSYAQKVTTAIDNRTRPGFTKTCCVCYTVLSSALKVLWCIHAQVLVAKAETSDDSDCAGFLPRFISWYSFVLLLQLLVVEPFIRFGMHLVVRAATSGILHTNRGAKDGTLDLMTAVKYDKSIFADPSNPADSRPQNECCFCLEEYDSEQAIIETPCKHMMHRECLQRWLKSSHLCPICRGDLEEHRLP